MTPCNAATKHRGALDHNVWCHAGAGETHRKDLQSVERGSFKMRKFSFDIDPRSGHQMKQIRTVPRKQEQSHAARNESRFTWRPAGGGFPETLRSTPPAAFRDSGQ